MLPAPAPHDAVALSQWPQNVPHWLRVRCLSRSQRSVYDCFVRLHAWHALRLPVVHLEDFYEVPAFSPALPFPPPGDVALIDGYERITTFNASSFPVLDLSTGHQRTLMVKGD